jgi:hypothetical protein
MQHYLIFQRKNILLLICLFFHTFTFSQTLDWAVGIGGGNGDEGLSIFVDDNGNVYTTGYFQTTADFDPSTSVYNLTPVPGFSGWAPASDVFIQKLDNQGSLVWAKSFGGTTKDIGTSITVDDNGNVYTTGYFGNTADFDPNSGIHNLTGGLSDIFIQKLDNQGNFVWAKKIGNSNNSLEEVNSITLDKSGNLYIIGAFSETVDFDPNIGVYNLSAIGNSIYAKDIFIQKLDSNGNMLWTKSFGGNLDDNGTSIVIDDFNNIYATGYFSDTVDFDPNSGVYNLISNGSADIFVQKLDSSGNMLWAKNFGGNLNDVANKITIDSWGNIYTTGSFSDTVNFNSNSVITNLIAIGSTDIFVQKLDNSGNFIWAKSMGGIDDDVANSITINQFGSIYTTGSFKSTVDFDPNSGIYNLTATAGNWHPSDIFIQKLDAQGDFVWAKNLGGSKSDKGNDITADAMGNVYTTGSFSGTVDFDFDTTTTYLVSGSTDSFDIFIQKIDSTNHLDVKIVEKVSIKIYPNPSSSLVNLELGDLKNVSITIFNIDGKKVYSERNINNSVHQITLRENPGIYVIEIMAQNKKAYNKLIIKPPSK